MLYANNIHKFYGDLHVLKGARLELSAGEILSITGKSGAGKSTLLHILGTLDTPDQGIVKIEGREVFGLKPSELAKFRNKKLGFVFQFHHLLPEFTALENVSMPALIANLSRKEAEEKAARWLKYLGLENRMDHKPSALSGGEQQRVAVARALINDPALILADEPSGNLDLENSEHLHDLFFRLRDEFNQTFILVTHNVSLAQRSDRMIVMEDGNIVEGNP